MFVFMSDGWAREARGAVAGIALSQSQGPWEGVGWSVGRAARLWKVSAVPV